MSTKKPERMGDRRQTLSEESGERYPTSVVGGAPATGADAPRDAYRDTLTHVDEKGDVRMVDVSEKAVTKRIAIAEGTILMHPETQAMVLEDRAKKGDVLACARVAGIMATKRTSELIPMCHPLMITKSKVEISPIAAAGAPVPAGWDSPREDGRVGFHVLVTCGVTGVTGIEMEALTGASVACLTVYDMCKAVDRGMEVVDVRLLRKEGGRSGVWERAEREGTAGEEHAGSADEPQASAPSALPGGPGTGGAAPAIAFIGYQNAGKTTLVEKVISRLSQRGLRVGSIKHHGHKGFDIDQPGKDSWRHAQAGSRHVGLISPNRYAEYADTRSEVSVEDLLGHYTDVDVVVVEGYKTAGLRNIVVTRSGVDRIRGKDSFGLIDSNTLAIASNEQVARDFRAKAAARAEQGGTEPTELPPFLDINYAPAIVSFVIASVSGWRGMAGGKQTPAVVVDPRSRQGAAGCEERAGERRHLRGGRVAVGEPAHDRHDVARTGHLDEGGIGCGGRVLLARNPAGLVVDGGTRVLQAVADERHLGLAQKPLEPIGRIGVELEVGRHLAPRFGRGLRAVGGEPPFVRRGVFDAERLAPALVGDAVVGRPKGPVRLVGRPYERILDQALDAAACLAVPVAR